MFEGGRNVQIGTDLLNTGNPVCEMIANSVTRRSISNWK
jgi:hypothetical protein